MGATNVKLKLTFYLENIDIVLTKILQGLLKCFQSFALTWWYSSFFNLLTKHDGRVIRKLDPVILLLDKLASLGDVSLGGVATPGD